MRFLSMSLSFISLLSRLFTERIALSLSLYSSSAMLSMISLGVISFPVDRTSNIILCLSGSMSIASRDILVLETKELARERGTTFREIVESALRTYLQDRRKKELQYSFRNHTFRGEGVQEGVAEGDWQDIRSRIYEGRGG